MRAPVKDEASSSSEVEIETKCPVTLHPACRPSRTSGTATPKELPSFPLCKSLLGVQKDTGYLVCIHVYRELNNHASQIYLRQRLKQAQTKGLKVPLHQLVPNKSWNCDDKKWEPYHTEAWDWCVSLSDLEAFVRWAQCRTRKPRPEKNRLFQKFNIHLSDADVKEIKVPIENEVLDTLHQCIPFKMELQYRVGKYRLDAFIPRLRLGIQIDEGGHLNYDVEEEKVYDEVVRDHNIVCLRFNPHGKYLNSPAMELVRQVWERTLAPDFLAFREKFKLV